MTLAVSETAFNASRASLERLDRHRYVTGRACAGAPLDLLYLPLNHRRAARLLLSPLIGRDRTLGRALLSRRRENQLLTLSVAAVRFGQAAAVLQGVNQASLGIDEGPLEEVLFRRTPKLCPEAYSCPTHDVRNPFFSCRDSRMVLLPEVSSSSTSWTGNRAASPTQCIGWSRCVRDRHVRERRRNAFPTMATD